MENFKLEIYLKTKKKKSLEVLIKLNKDGNISIKLCQINWIIP